MLKLISSEEIISPILLELWEELKELKDPRKKQERVELFWNDRDGPLTEEMEDQEDHYLVTFLFREEQQTEEIRVHCAAFGSLAGRGQMIKFKDPSVDIYFKSVYILKKSFLTYCFVRDAVPTPLYYDIKPFGKSKNLVDALNPHKIDYEFKTEPESNVSLSILTLPDTPEQLWIKEVNDAPKGKIQELYVDIDEGMRKKFEALGIEGVDTSNDSGEMISDAKNPFKYTMKIYLPPNYSATGEKYPVVMIFDGEQYTNPKMINTPLILDNLIHAKKIPPVVGIFVIHKYRNEELLVNPIFAQFIAKTVLPKIRAAYHITSDPNKVVVGGSSFGGLMSMYMGLNYPDLFGKILCQSGSFWAGDHMETLTDPVKANFLYLINEFVEKEPLNLDIYMEIGKYEGQEALFGAPSHFFANMHMRDVLKLKGYNYKFTIYNGGHEYAYWRGSIADGLIYLIGNNQ